MRVFKSKHGEIEIPDNIEYLLVNTDNNKIEKFTTFLNTVDNYWLGAKDSKTRSNLIIYRWCKDCKHWLTVRV